MRTLVTLLLCLSFASAGAAEFRAIDVYLESDEPIAAWQFRLSERNSMMTVVGIESGDSGVYSDTPYYDRDAVDAGTADRIIVADYSLAETSRLPVGRVRIATVHIMLSGDREPEFKVQLVAAATRDGDLINAVIELQSDTGSTP